MMPKTVKAIFVQQQSFNLKNVFISSFNYAYDTHFGGFYINKSLRP